jgi:riboflavin kinase/FMN adenylyltransferase
MAEESGRARAVVTIGAYDGVHVGHRALIAEVRRLAAASGLRSVVVTFDRHPASVVRPWSAPRLLTDLDQKLELLAATGVDEVVVIPFDRQRSQEPAIAFVEEVLVGRLSARTVVVGENFHFGAGREGDVALLRAAGREHGFDVVGFGLYQDPLRGGVVSSTRIRGLLDAGDVAEAGRLLGRPHELRAAVAATEPDGRVLLGVDPSLLVPAPGVYEVAAGPLATPAAVGARWIAEVEATGEAPASATAVGAPPPGASPPDPGSGGGQPGDGEAGAGPAGRVALRPRTGADSAALSAGLSERWRVLFLERVSAPLPGVPAAGR